MTFSLGGQGNQYNQYTQGHIRSATNVRSSTVGANPKLLQVPDQGSTAVNMASPQSFATYKADPIVANHSSNNFMKPPQVHTHPSALVQSVQQIERTTSQALLSGGIFATMLGSPIGLGVGLASAAVGGLGMLAEPLIVGGVQKAEEAFKSMSF